MKKAILATVISIFLSACENNSSSSATVTEINLQFKEKKLTSISEEKTSLKGHLSLKNNPFNITGLGYKTPTIESLTNNGRFKYKEGEIITFMIGGNKLFSVKGNREIDIAKSLLIENKLTNFSLPATTFDIRELLNLPPDNTIIPFKSLHKTSNTIRLLLILDTDRNANNGIDLKNWHHRLEGKEIELDTRLDKKLGFRKYFKGLLLPPILMDVTKPLSYIYGNNS